jgi:hypothetical protein
VGLGGPDANVVGANVAVVSDDAEVTSRGNDLVDEIAFVSRQCHVHDPSLVPRVMRRGCAYVYVQATTMGRGTWRSDAG